MEKIFESFKEQQTRIINEKFGSTILTDIINNNKKSYNVRRGLQYMNLKLDKITNSDFIYYFSMKEARKCAKDGGIVFWLSNERLLGISSGDWALTPSSSDYKSTMSISKDANNAYGLMIDTVKKYGNREIKDRRWASQQDATAFKTNSELKEDNLNRYNTIIARHKKEVAASELGDVNTALKEVMSGYTKLFDDLVGSVEWSQIRDINNKIQQVLTIAEDMVWDRSDHISAEQYTENSMLKNINDIKLLMLDLEKRNAKQLE